MSNRPMKYRASRKYRIEFTFFSLMLSLFLLFILLMWFFSLGIMVGKGYIPGGLTFLCSVKEKIDEFREGLKRIPEGYDSAVYTIQFGSFRYKDAAVRMLKALQSRGYAVICIPVDINGKTFYRVRLNEKMPYQEAKYRAKMIRLKDGIDAEEVRVEGNSS